VRHLDDGSPDGLEHAEEPRDVLQWWKDQFDQSYEEGEKGRPGLMTLGLHRFITGPAFMACASSKKGTWFTRGDEAAGHYQTHDREGHVKTWPHVGSDLPRLVAD
jgi:Cu/Zn superoxide dismutase